MDLRKSLFGNIVLSGGSTLTKGMLYSSFFYALPRGQIYGSRSTALLYVRYYVLFYMHDYSALVADRATTTQDLATAFFLKYDVLLSRI